MMRRVLVMLVLLCSSPAAAQSGAGTDQCRVGPGFECDQYVLRFGPDSAQRRVSKVIAIWHGELADGEARLPAERERQIDTEYQRARRAAEDADRVFMGSATNTRYHAVTISGRGADRWSRSEGLDSVFVANRAFRVPQGDTAIVLLISGPLGGERLPDVTTLTVSGTLPATRARIWHRGDTTFIVRAPRDEPNLPAGLLQHPEVLAFLQARP